MRFYTLSFFIFCLTFSTLSSQENTFEFLGVVKLNDSSFISYKLAFEENKGAITGYSLTDAGGRHETKSNITGVYDGKDKVLRFRENDIVYTKSPIDEVDFCLVHFEGKLRNLEKAKAFSGDFKGVYPDGSACLDGMIIVSNAVQVNERIAKIDRKVQRSRKVADSIKEKFSARRVADTLTMSVVKKGENLNIFTKNKQLTLVIYDSGKVDQDRIRLEIDGSVLLQDYAIEKGRKEIPILLSSTKKSTIQVTALDEGTSPPNTVKVEIKDGQNLITTRTSLKTGETATLTLLNQ